MITEAATLEVFLKEEIFSLNHFWSINILLQNKIEKGKWMMVPIRLNTQTINRWQYFYNCDNAGKWWILWMTVWSLLQWIQAPHNQNLAEPEVPQRPGQQERLVLKEANWEPTESAANLPVSSASDVFCLPPLTARSSLGGMKVVVTLTGWKGWGLCLALVEKAVKKKQKKKKERQSSTNIQDSPGEVWLVVFVSYEKK